MLGEFESLAEVLARGRTGDDLDEEPLDEDDLDDDEDDDDEDLDDDDLVDLDDEYDDEEEHRHRPGHPPRYDE
jgi:hypothetical protein